MKKDERFNIFVEPLRLGKTIALDETFPPDFLEISERDLSFNKQVNINGEVYFAGEELILHLNLQAHCIIPCSICNEPVSVTIEVKEFYYAEPLKDIPSGIFNYKEVVREAILLETPAFVECRGHCPKRKQIEKYLKTHQGLEQEEGYKPFADL